MPSYQNLTPPISVFPGDVGFSFTNEAFPGSAQAGSQFAITAPAGEACTVAGVNAKFRRIKFTSSTGGAGLTAKLLV